MSVNLLGFKPETVWKHFDALRQIPRESKNETAAGDYVISIAESNNLQYDRDEIGNIVVRVPATPGYEKTETVIIQGHLDMVCEKNSDIKFDFANDPIQVREENDWLYAQGTTLGADNGIGLAAALALCDDNAGLHGPLELLCTVDEETGLNGAARLKPGFLTGKTFLNLDSEEEGIFTIGCAGGADTQFFLQAKYEQIFSGKHIKIHISGLKGGHSGLDINKNRGNAIKFMVRLLWQVMDNIPFKLVNINGGSKRNAIPREIFVEMVIAENKFNEIKNSMGKIFSELELEYKSVEPEMKLTISELESLPEKVMDEKTKGKVLNFLNALPHGVIKMSGDIPSLVETSVNLATIQVTNEMIDIGVSGRSSIISSLLAIKHQLSALGNLVGAKVEQPEGYPGWAPDLNSKILAVVKATHKKLTGEQPEVQAIHAGLECGIIGEKYPGMDMVSLGPTIENPHSPDERVLISSVERFWDLLKATLAECAKL